MKTAQQEDKQSVATAQASPVTVADRPPIAAASLLKLQRTQGNRYVQRMLSSGLIQAKLTVSEPGDPYEQEADRVAEQVLRMPDPATPDLATPPRQVQEPQLQRMCSRCDWEIHRQPLDEEEEPSRARGALRAAPLMAQRVCAECEDELHAQRDSEKTGHPSDEAASLVHDVLRSPGHPLDSDVRGFFEPRFDRDFSSVRLHTDEASAASAQAINARAYTFGHHIVFGPGQFNPGTDAGRGLLAHELVHVAQQAPDVVARKAAPVATRSGAGSCDGIQTRPEEANASPEVRMSAELPRLSVRRLSVQPTIQRDFAIRPPRPEAVGRALTATQMADAIAFNNRVIGAGGADLIREVRDVIGTSPDPAVVDEDFVNAVVRWQAVQGLTQDGRLGPLTAAPLFREIGAERVGECRVASGATYTPGAPVPVPVVGGGETAHFALRAEFESDPANGVFPSCCEVRQFIRWNAASAAAFGAAGVPHGGFPAGTAANTFIEDRDAANNRYGHRSGPFSDPQPFDQYLDSTGARNQAFGHLYRGTDDPTPIAAHAVGRWQFYLKVIDVCRRGVRVGGDDLISINW